MAQIKIGNVVYGSTYASDITYKNTTVEKQLDLMPIFDVTDNTNVENDNNDYLTYANILDSLNSSDTDKALSANQGRILKESIDNFDLNELESKISLNTANISNLNTNLNTLDNSLNTTWINNSDVYIEIEKMIEQHGVYSTFTLCFGTGNINCPTVTDEWWTLLYKCARIIAWKYDTIYTCARNSANTYTTWIPFVNTTTFENKIPFSFGVDANGNYGYIKDGADTVTPFKKLDIKLIASNNTSDDPYLDNAEIGKTYVISYYSSRDSKYTGKFTSITGCEILSSLQLISTYQYGGVYQDLNVVFIKATSTSISSAVSSNGYTCWCIYQID